MNTTSVESIYFEVKMSTFPFRYGEEKRVGCYTTRNTAEEVAKFVRTTFEQRVSGGIDISITPYKGKIVSTQIGLRLEDTPMGCLTSIKNALTPEEVEHLIDIVPKNINPKLMISSKNTISGVDTPKYMCNGVYYCLELIFEPFDDSHKLNIGYYNSNQLAHSISRYINHTHQREKVGSGFDIRLIPYQGKFVEYESGQCFLKLGKDLHEIKSSINDRDYLYMNKSIGEAIRKWSGDVDVKSTKKDAMSSDDYVSLELYPHGWSNEMLG